MARRRRSSSGKSGVKRGGSKGKGWFSGHPLPIMGMRLLIALFVLFISRILFYLFNLGYYADLGYKELALIMLHGLRFDLSALLILNAPYILMTIIPLPIRSNRVWKGTATGFYFVANILGLMANFVDTIYFRFTLKRTTSDIFSYLGVGGDFDKLIPQFLKDFWYVAIAWITLSALLVFLATRFRAASDGKGGTTGMRFYLVNGFFFLVIGAAAVIGIRGGLQLRPITLVTAGNYTSAKYIPLVLNTPFTIAKTVNDKALVQHTYFKKEKDLAAVYSPVHPPSKGPKQTLNVFILILESFSREHVGALNRDLEGGQYQGYTPFLDSLIRHGLYFDALANGKTSIQGIPAILSSIPSLMNESFLQSPYAAGKFTSIAALLKPWGYQSAFFHGGTNGTMGFDSYSKLVGFDRYFGRTEYGNEKDYDGKWGIRDEEFFQYTARQLSDMKEPWVGAIFSLSSHHPYYVPGKYTNILRKGKLPIQQSVMYTDHALRQFFNYIQHLGWYDNTLFVITADHTSEGYYPWYLTNVGQYAVPLLFFSPSKQLQGKSQLVAQQTDIMPTVLNYLGYDRSYVSFGTNLLDSAGAHFSIHFISGLYGLVKDGWYLEFNGTRTTALFDLKKDPMQKNNLSAKFPEERSRLETFIKAYIQQYNNRVIENRLYVE